MCFRFFMHFYAFASIYMLCVLAVMISVYVFKATVPAIVVRYLHSVSPHQDPLSSTFIHQFILIVCNLLLVFVFFRSRCHYLFNCYLPTVPSSLQTSVRKSVHPQLFRSHDQLVSLCCRLLSLLGLWDNIALLCSWFHVPK